MDAFFMSVTNEGVLVQGRLDCAAQAKMRHSSEVVRSSMGVACRTGACSSTILLELNADSVVDFLVNIADSLVCFWSL